MIKSKPLFFARCNILKAEIIRLVAGLGVLKQQARCVERLVYNNGNAVVAVHVQQLFVAGGGMLDRDAALARNNLHP